MLVIRGGRKLDGETGVHGAKNSVLPILAATLINAGENVIHNCPPLRDVASALEILTWLGCRVRREGETVTVDSSVITRSDIPYERMREMRSSVIFLGPLIARCGAAKLTYPGGCELGPRPIDLHLEALRRLGVHIAEQAGSIDCRAEDMKGRDIILSFPSVGATENIMLAASACAGVTRIINAAREPEIVDLQAFLRSAGVRVTGAGGSEIVVVGGGVRQRTEHRVIPDRIEAATYLCAAAACGGSVQLHGVEPEHIHTVLSALGDAGCAIGVAGKTVRLTAERRLRSLRPVRTMPYPGFPTDAQAQLMAAACTAAGSTIFLENIFESRYRYVGELHKMGARISVSGRVAVCEGVPQLHGAEVACTDLRGGAALVIAAGAAEGESCIGEEWHIDRGYACIEESMAQLGMEIKRT